MLRQFQSLWPLSVLFCVKLAECHFLSTTSACIMNVFSVTLRFSLSEILLSCCTRSVATSFRVNNCGSQMNLYICNKYLPSFRWLSQSLDSTFIVTSFLTWHLLLSFMERALTDLILFYHTRPLATLDCASNVSIILQIVSFNLNTIAIHNQQFAFLFSSTKRRSLFS